MTGACGSGLSITNRHSIHEAANTPPQDLHLTATRVKRQNLMWRMLAVSSCGCVRSIGWMMLFLTFVISSGRVFAQDLSNLKQDMLNHGEERSGIISLSFIDGNVHQYAVSDGMNLTFIEEHWSKSGGDDVIEQWLINVEPDNAATHRRIVERNSEVLSVEYLGTEGAEDVVKRVLKKDEEQRLASWTR
jgi:hypothetical protein